MIRDKTSESKKKKRKNEEIDRPDQKKIGLHNTRKQINLKVLPLREPGTSRKERERLEKKRRRRKILEKKALTSFPRN